MLDGLHLLGIRALMGDYDAVGCGVEADIPKLYVAAVSSGCYGLEIGICLAVFCQVQVSH
jgi:hypothetical protein